MKSWISKEKIWLSFISFSHFEHRAFHHFEHKSLTLTRRGSQPVIHLVPPVSLTTPSAWAVCRGPPCIMGSVFPSVQLTITWTPTADAEVKVKSSKCYVTLFIIVLYNTNLLLLLPLFVFSSACHSSCDSCWGPSVSQCTSCLDGLLLHQGQCMEACGEGLYSQDNTCHSKRSISLICAYYRGHFKKHAVFSYCQSVLTVDLPAFRLSSVLPFLCGTVGLRLPPMSQARGGTPATVQTLPTWHLHSWMSCTQLPGLHTDMQRWVHNLIFFVWLLVCVFSVSLLFLLKAGSQITCQSQVTFNSESSQAQMDNLNLNDSLSWFDCNSNWRWSKNCQKKC